MSRPNWFLAFPLDGAFTLQLPAVPRNFRRFHPEDVHMTLAFLGPCSEQGAMRAMAALDQALLEAPRTPLRVTLAEVVAMGAARAYTALSALIGEGRTTAAGVLRDLRDAPMDAAIGRRDKRPPKPHVTLARPIRRASDEDRLAGLAWAKSITFGPQVFELDRIALYTWNEPRRERLFRIVTERKLSA